MAVTGTVRTSGDENSDFGFDGEHDFAAGRWHVAGDARSAARWGAEEAFGDGDRVVVTATLPDVEQPGTAYDLGVLDAAAEAGRLRERERGVAFPYGFFAATAREPSPATALAVLERATASSVVTGVDEAVRAATERGDVPLGAVRVAGRWADLGAFGPDCRFYSAQPRRDWPVLSPLVAPE